MKARMFTLLILIVGLALIPTMAAQEPQGIDANETFPFLADTYAYRAYGDRDLQVVDVSNYTLTPCYDFDGDGQVDVDDIMQVASCWRCRCGDACYDQRYDLDDDCDIDIVDIMKVVVHWGESCYRMHGLNFSPYIDDDEDPNKGGDQITDEELEERMEIIAPYTEWIRTFGCNDDLMEAGMFARAMGLNAAIGAWLGPESTLQGQQENQNQIDCLKDRAREGHVDIAIVGSEVLLRGDLSETDLINYINQVKQSLQEAGIGIPVTYADVYGVLLDHPNVMSAVDLVFVNYYPYWEGRKIDYAVAYVHRWHQQVIDAAGGKEVIVSEIGWPSCGDQIGDAVPSPENASFHFLNFVSWARANDVKYLYFEAFDESWKAKYEGPQGACWGIWDKEANLKPGMQDVFDGKTMPDNWSDPIPEGSIIDFPALPELTETNISTFVVAGSTEPDNEVWLNETPLPPDTMDEEGNFAVAVPLVEGDNLLELVIKSGGEVIASAEKTVHFNEDFSTGGKRLIYVDSVALGEGVPALPGTIVIDLDNDTLLGLIEDKHVVGISPDGSEIYTSDRTVISTDTHRELRTLAFTQDIPSNGFIISPDGTRLYS